jgi:hypothetical protein
MSPVKVMQTLAIFLYLWERFVLLSLAGLSTLVASLNYVEVSDMRFL